MKTTRKMYIYSNYLYITYPTTSFNNTIRFSFDGVFKWTKWINELTEMRLKIQNIIKLGGKVVKHISSKTIVRNFLWQWKFQIKREKKFTSWKFPITLYHGSSSSIAWTFRYRFDVNIIIIVFRLRFDIQFIIFLMFFSKS